MASFKQFINEYLNFTAREKTGIAGLLILIALFYFLPDLVFKEKDYSNELKKFEAQIAQLDSNDEGEQAYEYANNKYEKTELFEPFYFDPNTVDPQLLQKFGVPQYIIDRFTKFRNAGAKFYKNEDFKKLYGLSPELYTKLVPYIKFNETNNAEESDFAEGETEKQSYIKFKNQPAIIELNSVDSLALLDVKGVGPYLSSKILKYRKALGGFVKFEQLYEIYNIKPEQVEAIKPFITVNPDKIIKIKINTSDYSQLNGHPYISSKEANAIINYRKQHGLYKSKADLEKVFLLSKEMIEKIGPYLEY